MGAALGDTLTVEVGELLDQVDVVEDDRAVVADGQRVGVRLGRGAIESGRHSGGELLAHRLAVTHVVVLSSGSLHCAHNPQ